MKNDFNSAETSAIKNTDQQPFLAPEKHEPGYQPNPLDYSFLQSVSKAIRNCTETIFDSTKLELDFAQTTFPKHFERLTLVLYAPGHKRILVSRQTHSFADVFERLLLHPRTPALGREPFRLQMDFILAPPSPVDFYSVGTEQEGERHFEIGIDGLLIHGPDDRVHLFLPGDAYVRSIMGMRQLREYLTRTYGEDYLRQAGFERFHSESFLSGEKDWLRLYRGYPLVGPLTRQKIEQAVELAVGHIQLNQEKSGKFLYYYDASLDSRRDHEHPTRDPLTNPYYNILRHSGGALTCIYQEKITHRGNALDSIRNAIGYLLKQARTYDCNGLEGTYIYSERKAKLGGSGVALYLLAEYQRLTGDTQYQEWAHQLARHLLSQITASGEFIYYSIYLDQPVTEQENHEYFSFYYPGEAICGLAKYYPLANTEDQQIITGKLHKALEFLIEVRPLTRAQHYISPPSDAWLMMGIKELWDIEAMRKPQYAEFVFSDAGKMIDNMYKVTDAPYPDYAGAFYYTYGDYPYADGARCEGLLGAYELAIIIGDHDKARQIWDALRLAAWSVLHLVNTEDAIYFAPNPRVALGGIRFKYTRQWFRIDTIQHVASFFAKLLPYWESAEANSASAERK
jgi:hypothetical protein